MVGDFVEEAHERLERAVDLAPAAAEGNPEAWAALQREIHTLKGASGFLALDEFSELCHALEEFLVRVAPGSGHPLKGFGIVRDACNLLRDMSDMVALCAEEQKHLPEEPRAVELSLRIKAI